MNSRVIFLPDVSLNRARESARYGESVNTEHSLNLTGSAIKLTAPAATTITIDVLDLSGRRIVTLFNGPVTVGATKIKTDKESMSSVLRGVRIILTTNGNGMILQKKLYIR